jgi:acetyltransferase-like isoleucine patch superfamily enzyme
MARRLACADAGYLLAVIAVVTADRLLMAWKWWLLLRGRDAAVSLWAAVRAYYLASFAGWFLPMTVGADAVRIAALAGQGRTTGLVASVVLERAVGALAQGVLATISIAFLVALGLGAQVGPGERWVGAAALVVAFAAFPFSFRVAGWVAARVGSGSGWRAKLGALAGAYASYGGSARLVVAFFGLTLLEGCLPVVYHYFTGRALGLDPGWSFYIATVPLVFLVARLPVSLGGLGVLELSFVYLGGLLGLGRTQAFSIAVLAEALVLVSLVPGAVAYLFPARPVPARSVGAAAADDRLADMQGALFDDRRSAVQRYMDLFVGERGWWALVRYEAVVLFASWVPGALGLLLRRLLYPWLLGACGRNVSFGANVTLRHPRKIRIAADVAIDDGCVLDAKGTANDGIRIGQRVFLGRNTILACKDGDIVLEDGVNISYQCAVFSASSVRIGADTLLAAYCYVVGGGHEFERIDVPVIRQGRPSKGIDVGRGAWLGAGAILLDGVSVGHDAVVGAHAVVTQDVPPFAIAAGAPARVVRDRREPG